ncbi:hypothetical protein BDZ97DRAFT_1901353 [Flammula alnicola]|nr:hypothetical protein BDZ97DRAFT_1901353 [Flammula alnicola]
MTSHIPLALSILGTLASHYPLGSLTQKAAPPPPPSVAPSGPAQSTTSGTAASAPVQVSAPQPSTNPNGATSSTNSTLGTSPPTTNPVALCEVGAIQVCQLRPKHFDGTKTHPYCSKTCANKKLNGKGAQTGSSAASGNPANCDFCHNRPKYSDGTKTHDYCSKACARSANGPQRKPTSGGPPANAVCQAPGCQNPPHSGGHDYCSMAHKTLGESLCLMCLQAPKMANAHFCSQTCIDDAESKGPMILEVPAGHVTFKNVVDQFKASWRHVGTVCPPVKRVYKIQAPPASLAAYNTYKAAVEARGDKGHTQFCSAPNCSLCCIIRTSYDISLWGKKTGWGRYVNDYSHNDCKSSLKAILLNKVVDNTSLTAPPAGGSLNYDELVVYANEPFDRNRRGNLNAKGTIRFLQHIALTARPATTLPPCPPSTLD